MPKLSLGQHRAACLAYCDHVPNLGLFGLRLVSPWDFRAVGTSPIATPFLNGAAPMTWCR